MNQTLRIFVACAIGAFIGSFVALEFAPWWVGALLGGFVGYMAYEFKAVGAAAKKAFIAAGGWRPDRPCWREKFKLGLAFVGGVQTIFFMIVLAAGSYPPHPDLLRGFLVMLIVTQAFMFMGGLIIAGRRSDGTLVEAGISYYDMNPASLFFWHLPRGVFFAGRWLISMIKPAARLAAEMAAFAKRFIPLLFREIHSDIRLLCGVDAAFGTAIGYFTGNPLIGAVAGGLLGVLNYEIVSIRVLKIPGAVSILRRV